MIVPAVERLTLTRRHRQESSRLPDPPTDSEKSDYADRGVLLIICSTLISFGALIVSQVRFVFLDPVLTWVYLPFVVFSIIYFALSLCVHIGTRGFDYAAHRRLVASWRPSRYPTLDVFLPVCGEPIEILRNTWVHVFELIRAYPGTAVAYVLDDGASKNVQAMAASFGFSYIVRPDRGYLKKAGNLRYGFACSSGDFILLLDADFAPRADLMVETLPYFIEDPALGIVQTPQYFHTRGPMSWMERGAGAVQALFYRLIQVSLDRHDGAMCVGSCAVYRRTALAVNGGTTPIEHSEDIHTGFDLRSAGWGLRYVPIPLATGLCPSDPDSFLTQQYRWCTGTFSLLGSRKFWTSRMSWRTRCGYLSGLFYYVHTATFTFVAQSIPLILLTVMPQEIRLANYGLLLPSILYSVVIFPAWNRARYGLEAFSTKLLYGWAHLFALWDLIWRRQLGWQTTGSSKKKSGTRRVWVAVVAWNATTGLAWVLLAIWRIASDGATFIPLFVMGVGASAVTVIALASRRNHARFIEEAT